MYGNVHDKNDFAVWMMDRSSSSNERIELDPATQWDLFWAHQPGIIPQRTIEFAKKDKYEFDGEIREHVPLPRQNGIAIRKPLELAAKAGSPKL